MRNIAVIGGGAAGIASAIVAARKGANVTIFEKADRIAKKILVTGNGRCNLTNADINPEFYNNPEYVKRIYERVEAKDVNGFLESVGLLLKADRDGRVYPVTEQASTVVNCFLNELKRLNVRIVTGREIKLNKNVNVINGETFDNVILSVGNVASTDAKYVNPLESLNVKATEVYPSLVPLKTDKTFLKGMNGIRVSARLKLFADSKEVYAEDGEILFRDYGLSGIAVFNASHYFNLNKNSKTYVSLDLFKDLTSEDLAAALIKRSERTPDTEQFFCGLVNKNSAQNISAYLKLGSLIEPSDVKNIVNVLKDMRFNIISTCAMNMAQVVCGGLKTDEFPNLKSKKYPSLYAAGEALDVNGLCGGYNLHWAWASGIYAGAQAVDDTY